jgi:hypothetical protein
VAHLGEPISRRPHVRDGGQATWANGANAELLARLLHIADLAIDPEQRFERVNQFRSLCAKPWFDL